MARAHRFHARQQRSRRWLNFAWIADACARECGSIVADHAKQMEAFRQLYTGVLRGEFEVRGKHIILFLGPNPTSNGRWTAAELADAVRVAGGIIDSHVATSILAHCWVPRGLARRWFTTRNLPAPAHLFPADEAGAEQEGPTRTKNAA